MIKKLLLLVLLTVIISINAQSKASNVLLTNTEWVNENLDYLRFDDNAVIYNFDNYKQEVFFDLENKNLSFKVNYRVGDDFKTEEFNFNIKEINEDKLVIEPVFDKNTEKEFNKLDVNLLSKQKQYIFFNRGSLVSKIDFQKLTFHSSTCFGTCPSVSVEVDKDGVVHYRGKTNATVQGNFVGQLSKEEMETLKSILNRSQIHTIDKNWEQKSKRNDTPKYTYIIELLDGETIEINTNDQHPVLDKLSEFLIHLDKEVALEKLSGKHSFDKSNLALYKIWQY